MFEKFTINGYKVLFYKNTSKIALVEAVVNAGSSDETLDNYGTAHFLEHMMFKGTKKRNKDSFHKESSKYGSINAFTDFDMTCYHYAFLANDLNKSFDIFFDLFFNATLPKDEIKKENGVIQEEWQTIQSTPSHYFGDKMAENLESNIAHPIIGTSESIKKTTREKIVSFRNKYYTPDNMIIVVIGDLDVNEVVKNLNKILPVNNNKAEISNKVANYNLDDYEFKHASKQAFIALLTKMPLLSEDPETSCVRSVFHSGFGRGMHSTLWKTIRENLGFCYSINSGFFDYKNFGCSTIECQLSEKNIKKTKKEILKVIDDVKKSGFNKELLDLAKRNCLLGLAHGFDSSHGISNFAHSYFKNNDIKTYKEKEEKILGVTNKDIKKYASSLYDGKIKTVIMTGV